MTTDHDSPDHHERDFDEQIAGRLQRGVERMDLPVTTGAEAAASGRRMQARTRLGAAAGVVAVAGAAIVAVLTIQPLGTADVIDAPPTPTATVPGGAPDPTPGTCPSTPVVQRVDDPLGIEARLDDEGIEGWALLFAGEPPWPPGEGIKISWRLEGTGDLEAGAINPSGTEIRPDDLTPVGSNWDRPGDEWHSVWTFDEPGCWELRMTRNEGSASLHVQVAEPGEPGPNMLDLETTDERSQSEADAQRDGSRPKSPRCRHGRVRRGTDDG